jgi:two-component system, NtrC family, response regulator AtoC
MGEIDGYRPAEALIGESLGIRRVGEQLRKAALTDIPVLIVGESGTGKELAARLLHDLSGRRAHNFLKVNCPTVLSKQFESELFGHEPGAFPGATQAKAGKCEKADKGTLFLNEIGELHLALQPKLLHALQDFRVARIGASTERTIDIRAICTTSQDLEAQVAKGDFRADLFYRINVLTINMPPLRERLSDVPILMNHFIRVHSGRIGGKPQPMSLSLTKSLECYHWPGNVRELENLAKCYVVLGGEEQVISMLRRPDDLHDESLDPIDTTTPLRIQTKRAVQHLERRIILSVLQSHQWNRRKTARSLDISYRTLLSKIKDSSIPPVYREQTAGSLVSRA